MKKFTHSIVPYNEMDFEKLASVLEECEQVLEITDIDMLEEYNNILFDCTQSALSLLFERLIALDSDMYWRCMQNDGEKVMSIFIFEGEDVVSEKIEMTVDELAQSNRNNSLECGCGVCSGCDSCCGNQNKKELLDRTIAAVEEKLLSREEAYKEFEMVVKYLHLSLNEYLEKSVNEADIEEVGDLFLNSIIQLLLFVATVDGKYSMHEHKFAELLIDDFDSTDLLARIDRNMENHIRTANFWYEAEQFADCDMIGLILIAAVYLCAADADVNDVEKQVLETLFVANSGCMHGMNCKE